MPTIASLTTFLRLAYLLPFTPIAQASFDTASSENVAIYWGQNSHNVGSGSLAQQNLAYYCANTEIDIIPLAFLTKIKNLTLNFANTGNQCTTFSDSQLLDCPQIASDIATCQHTYQKTILLSIGGATYTEGGFLSADEAITAANSVWAMFGPAQSGPQVNRPFGTSVIDGFDFDFETVTQNMAPFAKQLRALMDTDKAHTGKSWMLTAAPQCPYPDAADSQMLGGDVAFDVVWVQFYNNYCGLQAFKQGASTQGIFNFDIWDHWAKTVSANPDVKILVGVPGSQSAAGTGYQPAAALAPIFSYCKQYSSFGGVMIWDVSQVYANDGFLDQVVSGLRGPAATQATVYTQQPQIDPSSAATAAPPPADNYLPSPECSSSAQAPPPALSAPMTLQTLFTASKPQTPMAPSQPQTPESPVFAVSTSIPQSDQEAHGNPAFVHHWNQCGGEGWKGGTVCETPWNCVAYSSWYSDCR